jgi:hypothetical protein
MNKTRLKNKIDDYPVLFYNAGLVSKPNYRILINEKSSDYDKLHAKMIRYKDWIREGENIFNVFDAKDINQNVTIDFCDRDCKVDELINIYQEIESKLNKNETN